MAKKMLTGIDLAGNRATNAADASAANDLVTLSQVQGFLAGLSWKSPGVVAATTTNGALATAYENGDTIDGVVLATGNRILIKDQSAAAENGIYVVNATGAPTRATDADSTAELENAAVLVSGGTVNADKGFVQTATVTTVGTTAQVWAPFGAGLSYTADGQGIELTSTTFSLELDGTTLSKSASGLRIGSGAAGAGLTQSNGVLAVGQGTGITVNADDVAVDTSVVVRKYAANCAATTNPQTFTHNLNTLDVEVQIVEVSTGVEVEGDITHTGVNAISVNFGGAPTAAQYRVVVQG